jgi:alpha-tubulin suppressor-like RCC1 family protein
VLADDTVACWGDDGFGELGDGANKAQSVVPVRAAQLGSVRDVAVGGYETCALKLDGSVLCLGYESGFQLPSPVHGATALAVGEMGCAVFAGGRVACWGDSEFGGQYGDGSTTPGVARFAVADGITTATAVAVGGAFACALLSDGTVSCWGAGLVPLAPGAPVTTCSASPCVPTPTPVPGLDSVVALSAGLDHACALRRGGTILCWGDNANGGLGDGTTTGSTTPVLVQGIADATAVSAGWGFTCALDAAGRAWCWGRNLFGELGIGTTSDSTVPALVGPW